MCRIWFLNTWIDFKKPKRHRSAHDVSGKVRPHRSYHAYVLWHFQYLSTAALCSTWRPQRGAVKWMRPFFQGTGDPKWVNQTCTEVVLRGAGRGANPGGRIPAMDSELGNAITHGCADSERPNRGSHIPATDSVTPPF